MLYCSEAKISGTRYYAVFKQGKMLSGTKLLTEDEMLEFVLHYITLASRWERDKVMGALKEFEDCP